MEVYWERLQAMRVAPGAMAWDELALRFAAFQPGVSACLVGTASVKRLLHNARLLQKGPLPEAQVEAIGRAFRDNDQGWVGQV